jgi:hypothetical protein
MANMDETDAIKSIDAILLAIEDASARDRVLRWASDKFSSKRHPEQSQEPTKQSKRKRKQARRKAKPSTAHPSVVKDLNVRPSNKKSFKDFAAEKNPTSNDMRNSLAIFYLRRYLGIQKISFNHVYTCYKAADWRVPANILNSLRQTSSRHGWIDPSDKDDIQLTPLGENLVEHDLPRSEKRRRNGS